MARDQILVAGPGMMGSGIAAMAALAGLPTVLIGRREKSALAGRKRAVDCIRLREENQLATHQEAEAAIDRLQAGTDLDGAAERAKLVIESITEDLPAKQELFQRLDARLPADIPICSNTSGLRITDIASRCGSHPERTITTHFWLPAHLVPLVEVVMGEKTDECLAISVVNELRQWRKAPVLVRRDLPGQLANRIFQAVIRESVAIVASGLASAEDVDTAIGCGMAMRFPVWGPLKHLDAIGLELGLSVQDAVLPGISAEQTASAYLRGLVAEGALGASAGRGFFDWSERSIKEDIKKRDTFIVEAVKLKERLDGG